MFGEAEALGLPSSARGAWESRRGINQKMAANFLFGASGVVLAAEKKEFSNLFVPTRESGKLYKMDDHVLASVSGIIADANILVDEGRLFA